MEEAKTKKKYILEQIINQGDNSVIKKGTNVETGKEVAIKIIKKEIIEEEEKLALYNEVKILAQIENPNAIKIYEMYEDEENYYIVMECLLEKSLLERISELEYYSEYEASIVIRSLAGLLRSCHSLGVVLRELDVEDLYYTTASNELKVSVLRIKRFLEDNPFAPPTPPSSFCSPEKLSGKGYNYKTDMWSLGSILYTLLCGKLPFSLTETLDEIYRSIVKAEYDFPSPEWDSISESAKHLISNLLVADPVKRFDSSAVLAHPWILTASEIHSPLYHVPKKLKKKMDRIKIFKLRISQSLKLVLKK